MNTNDGLFENLVNQKVVIDVSSQYVYLGTLVGHSEFYLRLDDADVHDLRDTATTRELYVLQSHQLGIRANRRQVWVRREQIVSVSALDDVIT